MSILSFFKAFLDGTSITDECVAFSMEKLEQIRRDPDNVAWEGCAKNRRKVV